MIKILFIFISLIFSLNSFADPRLEADIKKLSKQNAFINSEGKEYKLDECFGNKVSRQNEITDYLKSINF